MLADEYGWPPSVLARLTVSDVWHWMPQRIIEAIDKQSDAAAFENARKASDAVAAARQAGQPVNIDTVLRSLAYG